MQSDDRARQGRANLTTRRASLRLMAGGVTGVAAAWTQSGAAQPEPGRDDAASSCLPAAIGAFSSLDDFAVPGEPLRTGNVAYDSGAFSRALASIMTNRRSVPISGDRAYTFSSIFVPPGDYKVSGGFGADLHALGLWSVPASVTIRVMDDAYFIEIPNRLDYTYLSGLRILGGKGALRHSYTGVNVSNIHVVERNIFQDYSECAVSSDAENMPYWRVRENSFYCLPSSPRRTRGLALGGLLDNSVIDDNSFLRNRVHLQLGPIRSGSVQIRNNDFLSFTADFTDVDLWLIPQDQPGNFGTNTGQGFRIIGNKFGNELLSDYEKKAPRMLVAAAHPDPRQASSRALFAPDFDWKPGDDGAHWLRGLIIAENYITTANLGGTDGPNASFMDICVEKMDLITWRDNVIDGGRFDYLFHFADGGTRRATKDNTNWSVSLQADRGGRSPVRKGVSNAVIGMIDDANGFVPGASARLPSGVVDREARSIRELDPHADWTPEAGVAVSDARAASDMPEALVTFPSTSAGLYAIIEDIEPYAGHWGWLVAAVERPRTSAATDLLIIVASAARGGQVTTQLHQIVPISPGDRQTIALNWYIPADAVGMTIYLRAPYANAGADHLIIGTAQLSAGRTPAPTALVA